MPSWEGKSRGSQAGYRIFVFVLKKIGLRASYFLLFFVSFYFIFASSRTTVTIFNFYMRRLDYNWFKSCAFVWKNYYRLGQTLIDKLAIISGIKTDFNFIFEGEEHLIRMMKGGKGGILFSAHIGNWESAGHLLRRVTTKVKVIMMDAEHEQIKSYMNQVTGEKHFEVIPIREDLSHVYRIAEALQNNEMVCIHCDRYVEGNKTITMSFFGADAKFPLGPFLIASAFNVPVAFVYAMREKGMLYHFYSSELKYFYRSKKEQLQHAAEEFTADLEKRVRSYPDQWFNYYNFWA